MARKSSYAIAALVALTIALFESFEGDRYQAVGEDLLRDPKFEQLELHWMVGSGVEAEAGAARIGVDPLRTSAWLLQPVAVVPGATYRLRAQIRVEGVGGRFSKTRGARLVMFSITADGPSPLLRHHRDGEWFGTRSVRVESVFHLRGDVELAYAGADLHGEHGSLEVSGLRLERVEEAGWYTLAAQLLLSAFAATLVFAVVAVLRRCRSWRARALVGFAAAVIFVGALVPAAAFERLWEELAIRTGSATTGGAPSWSTLPESPIPESVRADAEHLETTMPPRRWISGRTLLRKLGHFGFFALLLVGLVRGRYRRRDAWLISASCAVVTECLQYYVPGRGPHLLDVGIDVLGASAGLSCLVILGALRTRARSRSASPSGCTPPGAGDRASRP